MNLLVFSALLVAAFAHGDHCGTDCLAACRNCPPLENDGDEGVNGTSPFKVGSRIPGDCLQLLCKDEEAVLIVEGRKYDQLVCFQGKWHFGYPQFLEETDSGMCLTPGNNTCDVDATYTFNENFVCECNVPFKDRTEEFNREKQVCSNCENKKHNIVLLIDNSGSMDASLVAVKSFISTFVQFLKVGLAGNRISVVTSSWSYEILINFGDSASTVQASVNSAVGSITANGQSYLGSGMEAVKAAIVQPPHDNDAEPHKLVVFTDGSVLHGPPRIQDITRAATKLEALGVETFVVATHNDPRNQRAQNAIANGVVANVFGIKTATGEDNFDVVDKLQKRICA